MVERKVSTSLEKENQNHPTVLRKLQKPGYLELRSPKHPNKRIGGLVVEKLGERKPHTVSLKDDKPLINSIPDIPIINLALRSRQA